MATKVHSPRLWQQFTVDLECSGSRLDHFLATIAPDTPRSLLQRLARLGKLRVDGKRVRKTSGRLQLGQEVLIPRSVETRIASPRPLGAVSAEDKAQNPFKTLWEDEFYLAVSKPSGRIVQGDSNGTANDTESLSAHLWRMRKDDATSNPRILHRIDKGCSGVLLLARTRPAAREFGKILRDPVNRSTEDAKKSVEKTYLAIVEGSRPPAPSWKVFESQMQLARNSYDLEKMYLSRVVEESPQLTPISESTSAVTKWRTISSSANASLLEMQPLTGRKHQLRVHCAEELQCPIVGDRKYRLQGKAPLLTSERLLLHAHQLRFLHPFTQKEIVVNAPLPSEFWKEAMRFDLPILEHIDKD